MTREELLTVEEDIIKLWHSLLVVDSSPCIRKLTHDERGTLRTNAKVLEKQLSKLTRCLERVEEQ